MDLFVMDKNIGLMDPFYCLLAQHCIDGSHCLLAEHWVDGSISLFCKLKVELISLLGAKLWAGVMMGGDG
jgi:hypothetical protein